MRCLRLASWAFAPILLISTSACGRETSEPEFGEFEPGNFSEPTRIDNEWLPLQPATQWIYEGTTMEDGESLPRRIEFTVTDLTKDIAGVRTVVAWIVDYSDGEVVEKEIAFYAQDDEGNVWYLGEYPEEYEDGEFVAAPAWIAGLQDARAGIKMWAEPSLGASATFQGWGPAVDWTDYAQVDQLGQQTCVPVDCYDDVLVIAESSLGETDAFQLKYYARGVGEVRVGWRGEDSAPEELELVELVQLSPEALARIRAEALELERHAYEISNEVYGQTLPAEQAGSVSTNPTVVAATQVNTPGAAPTEVVVYAVDLPQSALSEFEFWDDPALPKGRLVGTLNTGDELDSPPENDPHVTFRVPVQAGIPYRCWIHMKVGAPKGKSQANVLYVQFSDAVDRAGDEVLKPGTGSFLTAQGSPQPGWMWVGCDSAEAEPSGALIYFRTSGEVTVRLQAGMEGVGFDQFLLSPEGFLEKPPSEPVVEE